MQRERVARFGALDVEGPVCGLKAVIFFEGRSSTLSTRPAKQSSVQTSSTSPGLTFITGSTPPKVQA
jgi:hypothetical protein